MSLSLDDVRIEPMTGESILWCCLHGGPLSLTSLGRGAAGIDPGAARFRSRNISLLAKLTRRYGACALLALSEDRIVGFIRFYPRVITRLRDAGELCLQQEPPNGPAEGLLDREFPLLEEIEDRTLVVHCMMTGSSQRPENPFLRRGLGSRMAGELVRWAKAAGWRAVEADAFEDLPIIYEFTGSAGHTFWENQGFHLSDRHPHPHLSGRSAFVVRLEEQARAAGISAERARDRMVMRLDLA